MKEKIQSCFKGLNFEEGFGLGEVSPTEVRKKWFDTHALLSVVNLEERMEIFGESEVFIFFLQTW